MARYFLDTEFMDNGKTIELLSIGIVRDDGTAYYAVDGEADHSKANGWVVENVLPYLGTDAVKSREHIRAEVQTFLMEQGSPEIWGWYAAYDWVVLCQLFGRMLDLPRGMPMFCRDVHQLCEDVGNPNLPEQTSQKHNALEDARWTKAAWEFCDARRKPLWT